MRYEVWVACEDGTEKIVNTYEREKDAVVNRHEASKGFQRKAYWVQETF